MADETKNPLEMTDEEILAMNGPVEGAATAAPETETDPNPNPEAEASGDEEAATAAAAEGEAEAEGAGGEAEEEAEAEGEEKPAGEAKPEDKAAEKTEEKPEAEPKSDAGQSETVEAEIDYKAAYERIMGFKANGKPITLKNIDEAVQLMQMGANYTKKLQELQPQRKLLLMLQNNDLLDEGKLSFLIDVSRKDPEAIKKLLKDANIDPMDIDTSVEPAYLPGSHTVTDKEADFRAAVTELRSTSEGIETVNVLAQLDQVSKQALWDDATIVGVLHEQRQSGVYDLIADEVQRQKTIGTIPASTPFLQAYKQVGDQMVAQAKGQGGGQSGTDPAGEQTPQVVATRAATPKPTVANGDKAAAASPTKIAAKKAEVFVNPLGQSDQEFLKTMEGRL